MTSSPDKQRPLSPHLGIYKPQISSVMSILHRMTGVALALGLPVFVAWLVLVASGPDIYRSFTMFCQTIPAQVVLVGWTFAFFYHFWNGIRHLAWDAGKFLTLRGMHWTGWITLVLAFTSTIVIWLKIWGYIPA